MAEAVEEQQAMMPAGGGPEGSIVVAKDELLEILDRVRLFTEEYGELVEQVTDTESWRQNALARIVEHQERLDSGNSPLDRFGLILGLFQFLLTRGDWEHLSFKIPSRLVSVAEPGNGDLLEFSNALKDWTQSIDAVVAEVGAMADEASRADRENVYILLSSISSLFKAILRQDWDDFNVMLAHINLATSSREREELVRQIAKIAREIYNSLNEFSDEISIEGLSSTTEEIPDAVGKLRSVISHLEEAANANLDALERLTGENEDNLKWIVEALEAATEAEADCEKLMAEHPELAPVIEEALAILRREIKAKLDALRDQFGLNNESIVAMMANQGFQDLTGQTLSKVIDFIEALQFQLVELLKRHMDGKTPDKEAASDEPPQAAPAEKPRPASQDEVDQLLTDLGF
ncbi:MAG: protein phosphatase CheZ [SAR324 cluster bacterium]|nr:protein phosphatase CheZ [SAR324 cluster bacterium]